MNNGVGSARIGQWYLRWDKGEIFQVTGFDEEARTIEIQTFDGDLDEVDEESWRVLPLGLAEPPEDWTGPVDDVERDDLGYSETEMRGADWAEPLTPYRPAREAWEETAAEEEGGAESEPRVRESVVAGYESTA
ncbi:MAG TPA: DUF6763 family protein [Steroidobacteraceae bacterium]|nr:DUF6763 family protein [Steroidobacteraceae bacterium]